MLRNTTFILLALVGPEGFALRYHVDQAATGSGTGLTWANAFTDLQQALSVVIPGDEVWVAAGQYRPTATVDRNISFVLQNGLALYGGFAGTEVLLSERDVAANPTVLNGDIGQLGDPTDNSFHVITADQLTTTVLIDGFRVMNGHSTGSNNGGGLRATNLLGGHLIVRHCAFINNYAANYGGAIYLAAARLTLDVCTFQGNSTNASGDGGAVFNGNNNGGFSQLSILGCEFRNNTARRGACLYNSVKYADLLIDRCRFTANDAPINIIGIQGADQALLANSYLIGNTVNDFNGEVLYVNAQNAQQSFTMAGCTVTSNFNLHPGNITGQMVKLLDSQLQVVNSILHGNTSVGGLQVNTLPYIEASIVEGGHANGANVQDIDPQFQLPYTGSPALFDATLYDHHVVPGSPAIDAGNTNLVPPSVPFDLDSLPRVQGIAVDLGCYETSTSVSVSTNAPVSWLHLAPNPALDRVRMVLPDGGTAVLVELLDMRGERLRSWDRPAGSPVMLELDDLVPGVYVLVARTASGRVRKGRLIVQ